MSAQALSAARDELATRIRTSGHLGCGCCTYSDLPAGCDDRADALADLALASLAELGLVNRRARRTPSATPTPRES